MSEFVPTIIVPETVREEMLAHAREGAPEEVCGVLAGALGSDERRVQARHPAENVADDPETRYEIDPREQLELMEGIEASGREVVGFYHSHPRGPVEPSATDAAQATWPDRSYVIVSPDDGGYAVRSWRWTGESFVEETVRVVED